MISGKLIIGGVEWVALPDLGLPPLRARIDTGAHTSSLHAENLELFYRDGARWVRFRVPNRMRKPTRWWDCEAAIACWRSVRCTSGESERRPVIQTTLELGERRWSVDLNLTSRERMRYHFLLGRSAMADGILVNPGHVFLHGRPGAKAPDPPNTDSR